MLWLSIKNYRKRNKKYEKEKIEVELKRLQWLMFKQQLELICEFLPDPNEKNPFEKKDYEKQPEKNE